MNSYEIRFRDVTLTVVDENVTYGKRSSGISSASRRLELAEGPVRGLAFHNKGCLVLHGSCVNVAQSLIAIVGPSGSGKSTLAAALSQRGAMLVSDGMTPVDPETLLVAPGPARTKLNDESLRLLGQEPSHFHLVHPESAKRYFPILSVTPDAGECAQARSNETAVLATSVVHNAVDGQACLRLILIVEDADETEIVPIAGSTALIQLIKNVYLGVCLPKEQSLLLMQRAAAVIQRGVAVKALRRKKEPGQLFETVEAIEREAAAATVPR
jgi:energy-coupling factor transporter ATP-binding protein EcfA2